MSKLTKEYDKLAKEAKNVKGKSYPIEARHYGRAKGTLTLTKK